MCGQGVGEGMKRAGILVCEQGNGRWDVYCERPIAGGPARKRSLRAGMTLVETVVALLVFGICVAGLTSLVLTGRELSNKARDHYTAINIAKNRIELARAYDFERIGDFRESVPRDVNEDGSYSGNGNFRRSTLVATVSTNLVRMSVIVGIRNRRTLAFSGEAESNNTYVARDLAR